MADKVKFKAFPTAFKLAAIKRLEAGEAVLPLARKLGVSRKLLHDWRKAWKLHGPAGLNRKRGPKRAVGGVHHQGCVQGPVAARAALLGRHQQVL
jgi:transposase-like protein